VPEPLTSFVGRERELVEIKRLLSDTRLLTLVGVGGIGKTRLALQLAAEVVSAYRDGAWLVDLAPVVDSKLVPSAVAHALGAREVVGKPLVETLCSEVVGRELLLIFDNCEHLRETCAHLASALLGSAAELTILATSREPLQVTGEQTYSLASLSLPERGADVEAVARSEAVQLFLDRAQKQQPGFALTASRVGVITQLCIRLDGIPLALELAAARLRSLSVEQIAARLDDRFRLLTSGTSTALPRQKTLRATLDWSYDLLAEDERAVLRRLSIFPGSFTLEAATSVASDAASDEFAVVDLVSQLVARSLVVADTKEAWARYRLLETMRAYAVEKLLEVGETDGVQRRHARYFNGRFDAAFDEWLRLPEAKWRSIYLREVESIRAALDWSLGPCGEGAIGIALAGASGAVWLGLSLTSEGQHRLEAAVARVDATTPASHQARLWLWLGLLLIGSAPAGAVEALEHAVELYRRVDNALGLGYSLARLGAALVVVGRFEQAARALAEARTLLEPSGVPKALAACYDAGGLLKLRTDDQAAARLDYERALALYRSAGAERQAFAMRSHLADLAWVLGDLDAALAGFRETLGLLRASPLTNKGTLGICLANLAGVLVERGELAEALATAREGLPLLREGGYAWMVLDHFAVRAALAGESERAVHIAGYADSVHAEKQASRQPNEARARARLEAILRERLAAEGLERLLAEGAAMSEEAIYALALED